MFGIQQNQLVQSLENIRKSRCGYLSNHCDCKYLKSDEVGGRFEGNEQTGCCEIRMALEIIQIMTPQEFKRITNRAKIVILGIKNGELVSENSPEAAKRLAKWARNSLRKDPK